MRNITIFVMAVIVLGAIGVVSLVAQSQKPPEAAPPPPTMSPAPNQDQLDKERAERQQPVPPDGPTSTPDPSKPTPTFPPRPTEDPGEIVIISPTRENYPPTDGWNTYTDQNTGFSFDYPSNWIVSAPTESVSDVSRGYVVSLTNYDPTVVTLNKDPGLAPNEIKMQFIVYPNPDEPLDSWIYSIFHPQTELVVSEKSAPNQMRWSAKGGILPQETIVVGLSSEEFVYVITYAPTETIYVETVEEVITTFQVSGLE